MALEAFDHAATSRLEAGAETAVDHDMHAAGGEQRRVEPDVREHGLSDAEDLLLARLGREALLVVHEAREHTAAAQPHVSAEGEDVGRAGVQQPRVEPKVGEDPLLVGVHLLGAGHAHVRRALVLAQAHEVATSSRLEPGTEVARVVGARSLEGHVEPDVVGARDRGVRDALGAASADPRAVVRHQTLEASPQPTVAALHVRARSVARVGRTRGEDIDVER
mmetsp:Transcript_37091/g.108702  ORF Transcript_37091/g.108702 Transcript_37091/m.108702 type:complete len:221 (-) Transcript_37091:549-1211(-)